MKQTLLVGGSHQRVIRCVNLDRVSLQSSLKDQRLANCGMIRELQFKDLKGIQIGSRDLEAGAVVLHGIPADKRPVAQKGYDRLAAQLWSSGISVVIPDLSGTPPSSNEFSPRNWLDDLKACLEFLRSEYSPRKCFVVGFSFGGAIGILGAAQGLDLDGLILCATPARFDSRVFRIFLEFCSRFGYLRIGDLDQVMAQLQDPEQLAARIRIPCLLIHGAQDRLVRSLNSYWIYRKLAGPKQLAILDWEHRLRIYPPCIKLICSWIQAQVR